MCVIGGRHSREKREGGTFEPGISVSVACSHIYLSDMHTKKHNPYLLSLSFLVVIIVELLFFSLRGLLTVQLIGSKRPEVDLQWT